MKNKEILYFELKTGYNDNGPAWIGLGEFSKSGKTIYFNNKAFQPGNGSYSNYFDIETKEDYWISGVKKNQQDRHWAGSGKIKIDKNILNDYLNIINKSNLESSKYEIFEPEKGDIKERVNKILNEKL